MNFTITFSCHFQRHFFNSSTFFSHPKYNKKKRKNVVLSFLLNFGGGVLIANCFCHWLPEVREGNKNLFQIFAIFSLISLKLLLLYTTVKVKMSTTNCHET